MIEIFKLIGQVAGSRTNVIIRGESGTGKELIAQAGKGTIFLDEIGDTSPDFQSKLLRVLQEHEFYPVGAERPEHTEARVIAGSFAWRLALNDIAHLHQHDRTRP